mmetsp:Transcript_40007/g.92115  ORF Transcript_40007/g.92115 Transcript_40007/m.92115 type:complete len:151 (+) Transcript_40007:45-497(+)
MAKVQHSAKIFEDVDDAIDTPAVCRQRSHTSLASTKCPSEKSSTTPMVTLHNGLCRFCGAQEDEAVLMTPCCCIGRHQHAAHLKCLVRHVRKTNEEAGSAFDDEPGYYGTCLDCQTPWTIPEDMLDHLSRPRNQREVRKGGGMVRFEWTL